jgi:beta-1,4-mannosyl-glycoprotein beta-1,4-N-acetylglucosaminyltransferase
MAKVIDCFTFYNEFKILDLRLAELKDVVDHFILVEATKTHSGENKRLYFDEVLSYRKSNLLLLYTSGLINDL